MGEINLDIKSETGSEKLGVIAEDMIMVAFLLLPPHLMENMKDIVPQRRYHMKELVILPPKVNSN